jgi:hypothetical protein
MKVRLSLSVINYAPYQEGSRDSAVGIATSYGQPRGRSSSPGGGQEFSLLQIVQTGSEIHPTSYPMDTGGSFPRGKTAGAWSWPLTSN